MRRALALAAVLIVVTVTVDYAALGAEEPPTDAAIIGLCGARMANVFARFGVPENLSVSGDNDGGVNLDYGTFGFKIKNKTAVACFFWENWKGPVKGIKIGDTKEQVLKTLGTNKSVFKHPDGLEDYAWEFNPPSATLWAYFDKDNKVKKIDTELK